MIAALRGIIFQLSTSIVEFEVNDVIYRLLISLNTYEDLQKDNSNHKILIYTRYMQKEGPPSLYGFSTTEEAEFFDFLITLTGIGANSALQIISHYELNDLETIFINKDIKSLTKVPGIGERKAKQMLLDSESKLKRKAGAQKLPSRGFENNLNMLENALSQLGYSKSEIERSLERIQDQESLAELPVSEQVKSLLKVL